MARCEGFPILPRSSTNATPVRVGPTPDLRPWGTQLRRASRSRPGLSAGLVAVLLLAGLGGCATQVTRRDEYYLIRGLTFQPQAGDGTTISVGREREVLRDIANAGQVQMRGVELDR